MTFSRSRKIAFGALATLIALVIPEVGARAYSIARFHNPRAIDYGVEFIHRLSNGTVYLDTASDSGEAARLGAPAEALFDHRDDVRLDGLELHSPRMVAVNGGGQAHINSFGYRGPEFPPQPPAGVPRIATFGGSYTFGAYLTDEETWPVRLAAALGRRGATAEIINAGVSGASIHGILQELIRVTNRAHVDYAVVTEAYNNHPLLPLERRFSIARKADLYLYNLSMFYVLAKEKIGRLSGEPLDFGLYHQRVHVRAADVEGLLSLYHRRLSQLHIVCHERGVTLVLASQPEVFFETRLNQQSTLDSEAVGAIGRRIQAGDDVFLAELDFYLQGRFNLEARRTAAEQGDLFFDGARVLDADKPRYFVDQIHPGPEGARTLAAALADFFVPILNAHR